MKVTKVVFEKPNAINKSLALCSVILDDCLKLSNINLYKNEKGYYLVLPSRQIIYQELEGLNPDVDITYPKNHEEDSSTKKKVYEEFFYPVESFLYKDILNAVEEGYAHYKHRGKWSYRLDK